MTVNSELRTMMMNFDLVCPCTADHSDVTNRPTFGQWTGHAGLGSLHTDVRLANVGPEWHEVGELCALSDIICSVHFVAPRKQ